MDCAARQVVAPLGVAAAWHLSEWSFMSECVEKLPPTSLDTSFYKAVLCIHRNNFRDAQLHIDNARKFLYNELAALISESYSRAYDHIIQCQKLCELEVPPTQEVLLRNSNPCTWPRLVGGRLAIGIGWQGKWPGPAALGTVVSVPPPLRLPCVAIPTSVAEGTFRFPRSRSRNVKSVSFGKGGGEEGSGAAIGRDTLTVTHKTTPPPPTAWPR